LIQIFTKILVYISFLRQVNLEHSSITQFYITQIQGIGRHETNTQLRQKLRLQLTSNPEKKRTSQNKHYTSSQATHQKLNKNNVTASSY